MGQAKHTPSGSSCLARLKRRLLWGDLYGEVYNEAKMDNFDGANSVVDRRERRVRAKKAGSHAASKRNFCPFRYRKEDKEDNETDQAVPQGYHIEIHLHPGVGHRGQRSCSNADRCTNHHPFAADPHTASHFRPVTLPLPGPDHKWKLRNNLGLGDREHPQASHLHHRAKSFRQPVDAPGRNIVP